jgi:class 3 adenylate cyclase/tetratricopeptide (TPR) repeat protein
MTCPGCGTQNEPGGRFCEACGTPLAATCPSCSEPVKADARFCRNCGFQIAADTQPAVPPAATIAAAAPVAERRLVTVLFADLVGFTTLAEDRDPESTRELLTRYFDVARDAIERHGGTVEKFIGDAVMAVWGTPVAHEDDAERAVRAGLELVKEVSTLAAQLQARAGVLTGEAAVTLGATNQGMVAGDLVNTAARLQGVAEPGTVLVGEPTMRAAERAIMFEEVGEHSLKGKLAPVPAWRAVRVVAQRGGEQRADALEPPFVGRDEELRLLKEQLHAPGRDQRARLVSITGPGGIGKSRLVWELEKYMDGVTELVYWHRGRSPSYGEGITFWALGEMVRRRADLTEDDDEATTRQRIHATVEEYVADPDERAMVEPALLALLGLADVVGGRDALFPAWRTFFERISERGTTALVFEDLQWADSGLLDFIEHLLDWSKSRPILVVTLARPELFDKRPDWGAGRRAFTSLALDPLADDAIRQLLEGVVPGLPESAITTIVSRAEGMPLYAVETVRALLAEGKIERDGDVYRPVGDLQQLTVPESLRSLIASRLDALDPADRALLQDASVLGQVFDLATLSTVTGEPESALDERMRDLARGEIVELETDPRSPERGQYKFVQALIREVAYGTLALRDRRSRHLALARHYEAAGDDEMAGVLASHYLAAHEFSAEGPEADAVAAQARIALRAAVDRAVALGAHEQAVAHIEHALRITTDDAERADLLERAAASSFAGLIGDTVDYARRALAAREAVGDVTGTYRATALVAQTLLDLNRLEDATELLTGTLAKAQTFPDVETEVDLYVALSRAHMRSGRPEEAMAAAEHALTLAEPHNLVRAIADAMNNRAASLNQLGRRREAIALLEAALRLADDGGWQALAMRLRNNLAVSVQDDDPVRAAEIGREMLAITERLGHLQWYLQAAGGVASNMYAEMSDWDRALALVEDAAVRDVVGSLSWVSARTLAFLIRAARGEDTRPEVAEIEATGLQGQSRWWVDAGLSDAGLFTGDFETTVERARACIASPFSEANEGYLRSQLALALIALRRVDEAGTVVAEMRDSVFQGAMSQALLQAGQASLLALEGRTDEARASFAHAFAEMRRLQQLQDLVRWELEAVSLLPEASEASAWAAEVSEIGERVGAVVLLSRLTDFRPGSTARAAATAERSEEPVSGPS